MLSDGDLMEGDALAEAGVSIGISREKYGEWASRSGVKRGGGMHNELRPKSWLNFSQQHNFDTFRESFFYIYRLYLKHLLI